MYRGRNKIPNPTGVETEFQQWALNVQFQQDQQHRWSLTIPTLDIEQRDNSGVLSRVSGLADLTLIHGWRPLEEGPWELLLGLELPTGEELDAPAAGVIPPSLLQLGSGTWDPILGASWMNRQDSFSHTVHVAGIFPIGSSDADLDPGNLFQAIYRVGWQPISSTEASLGFEGILRTSDVLGGATLGNTRSTVYALRPGLRVDLGGVSVFLSARFPFAYDVDATQIAPGNLFEFWVSYGG